MRRPPRSHLSVIISATLYAFLAFLAIQVFYDWELDRKGLHRGGFHPERVIQNTFDIHLISFLVWLAILVASGLLIERFQRALSIALAAARRRSDELALVSDVGAAMSEPSSTEEIAAAFLRRIGWVFPVGTAVALLSLGREKPSPDVLAAVGVDPAGLRSGLDGVSPVDDMFAASAASIVADVATEPERAGAFFRRFPAAAGARSFAVAPLPARAQLIGSLVVWNPLPGAIDAEHVGLLTSLGRHLAGALANADLVARATGRAERQAALNRLAQRMRATLDLREMAAVALPEIRALLQAASVRISVDGGAPGSAFDMVSPEDPPPAPRPGIGESTRNDPSSGGGRLLAPMVAAGQTFGVLTLDRGASGPGWSDDDAAAAEAVAHELALGVATSHAFERQRAAVRELERLNRAQTDFVAMVAHEFRTPLTGIQGFSEIIRDYDLSAEEIKEYAGDINADARRLSRMITAQLDVDRLQSGRIVLQREVLDLNRLLRDVVESMSQLAPQYAVALELAPDLPPVLADRDRLIQVATNLLGNAIAFSPPDSPIEVRSRGMDGCVRVMVRDRGVGIAKEHLDRIFEAYVRLGTARPGGVPGIGLGLAIVRLIVELHGGRVWVESAPGEGAAFFVEIPHSATDVDPQEETGDGQNRAV
ncbi:MAG: ATP-binding protein [Thermomicrobiales bacterium]